MIIPKYVIRRFSLKNPYAIVRTPNSKIDAAMRMLVFIGAAVLILVRDIAVMLG